MFFLYPAVVSYLQMPQVRKWRSMLFVDQDLSLEGLKDKALRDQLLDQLLAR